MPDTFGPCTSLAVPFRPEILFQRALILIDDARAQGIPVDDWTFGGGTVLDRIRRHEHSLRESFESLTTLDYRRSFDECVQIVKEKLAAIRLRSE